MGYTSLVSQALHKKILLINIRSNLPVLVKTAVGRCAPALVLIHMHIVRSANIGKLV